MEYHYIKHSQICCFTLRSIVCVVVLQSQNCFHMWNLECTSEKSSLQMNIPVRKCEVLVDLCQFFPVVSNTASNIHVFHGTVPKLKTVTTCWLAHLTFILWKWFSCMWQCLEMWTSDVKRQVIFMCLVLFPHGEVQIFKWKKAINYEKMSFTCENVHSCMEIVTNMWHYFHFPCENGQIASVIFPRGSWRQRILSFGWHFAFFRMAWQECRQEICTNATQTKT